MNETNELNDIILNKSGSANNNKKIILAVATLGVILIVVVMLMNSLTSNGTENLPQTPILPKTQDFSVNSVQNEALFEEVEILEEETQNNNNLDAIASRLKEESQKDIIEQSVEEEKIIQAQVIKEKVIKEKVAITPIQKVKTLQQTAKPSYYVQVGSFSKYAPNKKFLKKITDLGYSYKFHKITIKSKIINKVLIGPFKSSAKAKNARTIIRAKIEPGAFFIKI